ncbi:hypothetical protein FGADI_9366 [Fusarium gaditjirri]|uniref:Uncharacterized protein n=1 Tax=Fusarium gaditjirri TaxID=282569 RepID=A0A8H4T082_9HYPO|nr:hypothetical protein FGADI_9366 [Fusarium gaditjirri]
MRVLKSGRSKTIINISSNGGGQISRAFDLFKLFFPTRFPFTAERFRRHQASEDFAKVYSVHDESIKLNCISRQLAWAFQVTPDQEDGFGSCEDVLGNRTELGVKVGSLQGVQTLAFGGQPNKPVQPMGGVRGLDFIAQDEVKIFVDVAPRPLTQFPIILNSGQVNFFNSYQNGDGDLPLQFQYQAADYRLYCTADNVFRSEITWESAKAAIWGNGSCIEGSMGRKGSLKDKSDMEKKGNATEDGGEQGEKGSDRDDNGANKVVLGWTVLTAAIVIVLKLL